MTADTNVGECTEEALRKIDGQARWLARFPEENPNPVLRVSADGIVLYRNPAAAANPDWHCQVGQALQQGPLLDLVRKSMAKQGALEQDMELGNTPYSVSVAPFLEENYANIYGHNIAERKRLEARASKESENLQAIFNVVNIGMILVDENGSVTRVNDALSKWLRRDLFTSLGEQPGDVVGCIHALANAAGCGHTAYCQSCVIRQTFQSVLRTGQPVRGVETETSLLSQGQPAHLWLDINADPLTLNGRKYVLLAMNNITAAKRAEQALHQAAEELKRSNQDLEQFAYAASHDLQEPLRMISGFLKLLEDRYSPQLDDSAKGYINYAVDGATRMSHLIRDLLEYSRIGQRERQVNPVDAGLALAGALENLRSTLEDSNAAVTFDPQPSLIIDPVQLTQLFQNLLSNAIKFRSPNRPCRIHIGAHQQNGFWKFSVKDNGIGIPSDQAERIFVIFKRLHSRDEYPGTGIGLALCKKIVERHGGRIWVDSEPDKGSTFYFTLPRAGQ